MKQSDNTNRTPANWDGTPQEDYFADWNTPPEEYPAAGRHLSPEAREEYYAERDAYYARRDAYYAQRDAYYAQRECEERAADEEGEEYEEKYGEDCADERGRAGGGRGRRFLCPRGPLRNAGGAEREAEKEKAPPQRGLSAVSCHGHRACDRRAGGHRQSAGAKSG